MAVRVRLTHYGLLLQYATLSIRPTLFRLTTLLVFAVLHAPGAHAYSLMPSEVPMTQFSEWQTMAGDFLIVDTKENVGYLVHRDGGFTQFPVATGQRRVVRYIGRIYNARTPNTSWAVLDKEVKGDRTTFGKEGLFLRLFDEDGETAYGIHSHRSIDAMLAGQDRYRSMGCILVSQTVLDNIEATFEGNGRRLDVLTVDGLGDDPVNYETLKQKFASK